MARSARWTSWNRSPASGRRRWRGFARRAWQSLDAAALRREVGRTSPDIAVPSRPARRSPRHPEVMAVSAPAADRIGEQLVHEQLITREQLQKALDDARANGSRIGFSLVKLGF